MAETQIALRNAINVLRDTIEIQRMPSGEPLTPDTAALHERAAEHLGTPVRGAGDAADAAGLANEAEWCARLAQANERIDA
jgi:hypothetical protein